MFCPRGGVRWEEQGMKRDELVDRVGGNPPPDSEKPNVDKGARIRRQEGDDLNIVETWL